MLLIVRWARAAALLIGLLVLATPGRAQVPASISGRILDRENGEGIAEASVVLVDSGRGVLSDSQGTFRIPDLAPGDYSLRVVHVAYGEFTEAVRLEEGQDLALRILMSQTAIELQPVVVEALSGEEFEVRSRGTRRNVVTREDIARSQTSGGHLGHVLVRHVPGIRLRSDQNRVGSSTCIEFRSPVSILDPYACKHPVIFLDGVRVANPEILYATLPVGDIERMEVIPPGEAGVAYGTDSRYGVLVIETRTAASVLREVGEEPPIMVGVRYDWSLEPEPYGWKKVFGFSFLGGLAGLALGYAVSDPCLNFDDLSSHFYAPECGRFATAASRVALMTLPQLGASLAARYSGSTAMSRGKFVQTLVATSFVAVPGIVLSITTAEDGFGGSDLLGKVFLLVGMPASATLADWMFRRSHEAGQR